MELERYTHLVALGLIRRLSCDATRAAELIDLYQPMINTAHLSDKAPTDCAADIVRASQSGVFY